MKQITTGNFRDIIAKRNDNPWVVGHFMEHDSPFRIRDFEIKWSLHPKGESKGSSGTNMRSKTLAVLIRGKFSFQFSNKRVVLDKEGDHVYWDRGISHTWAALEESLMITIRWPSIPNDQEKS